MSGNAVAELLAAQRSLQEPSAVTWRRVALGELSPDEAEAQLEAQLLGGRSDVTEDERVELERAKRVFAPPSKERREAALEALRARMAAEDEALEPAANESMTEESGAESAVDEPAVVVSMEPHRTRRWVLGLLGAAAAAVLTVEIGRRIVGSADRSDHGGFPGGFTIELDYAVAEVRGAERPVEVPTFLVDGKIGIRLVPEDAVSGAVGVVVHAWDRQGRAHALTVEPTVHDNGVVEIETTMNELGLGEGEWELVVAVGWTEALPGSWQDVLAAERGGAEGVQVVRTTVRVVRELPSR